MAMPITELDLDIEPVTDSMGGSDEADPVVPGPPAWEPPKGNWSELELCFLRIQDGGIILDDFIATNAAFPNRLEREAENNRILRVRAAMRHAVTGDEFDRLVREAEDIAARNKVTIQKKRDKLSEDIAIAEAEIRKLESEASAAAFKAKLAGDARNTLRENAPQAAKDCFAQRSRAISDHYVQLGHLAAKQELQMLKQFFRNLKENQSAALEGVQRSLKNKDSIFYVPDCPKSFCVNSHVRELTPKLEARIRELEPIVAAALQDKAEAEEALRRETIDAYTGG